MTEGKSPDPHRTLRLVGVVIGLIGVVCALVSSCLAFTLGHYAKGFSTLGAGLVFGTIFVSQYIRQISRK